MSPQIFFISDLHIGHKNILNFSPCRYGENINEHDRWIIAQWNSVVRPKDIVYCLGDVVFDINKIEMLNELNGQKMLVRGNHDKFPIEVYLKYFNNIYGMLGYKGFWLSHCPIHPDELRGKRNIHGHVHNSSIPDDRYINVCVEALNGVPISLDQLRVSHC